MMHNIDSQTPQYENMILRLDEDHRNCVDTPSHICNRAMSSGKAIALYLYNALKLDSNHVK